MERQPGQKEYRYAHPFGERPEEVQSAQTTANSSREERLQNLEQVVAELREELQFLKVKLKDLLY